MIKQFCIVVFMSVFALLGCTSAVKAPVDSGQLSAPAFPPHAEESSIAEQSALTPELLYMLLGAEMAGQRGAHELALEGYLAAAKRSQDPRIAERAAQIALFLKNDVKALEAAQLWRKRDPGNVSAMKVAIMFHIREGDMEEAYQQLVALADVLDEVKFGDTLLDVVKVLVKETEQESAAQLMARLSRTFPDKSRVYYAQAVLLAQQQAQADALAAVDEAIRLQPEWIQASLLKAQLLTELKRSQAAERLLAQVVAAHPDDAQSRLVYTQLLVKNKKFPAAERQFQRIIKDNPDNAEARFTLAMLQLQMNRPDQAHSSLLELNQVRGWRERSAYYLGRLEADRKRHTQALNWFEAVSKGPMLLDAQMNIALMQAELGHQNKALAKLEQVKGQFPAASRRIYLAISEIYGKNKDYRSAYRVLSEGLEELPGQTDLLYSRALIAERLGDLGQLESDLLAILEQQPEHVNALNALGYTLADKTTRLVESQRYLDQAIQLKPDDPVILDSYGWLQFRLKNLELALDYLRRAYAHNQDPEIAAHLGEVLWALGKHTEAKKIWKAAEKQAPGNDYIQQIRQRFGRTF